MAKISALELLTTSTGAEIVPVVQGGRTKGMPLRVLSDKATAEAAAWTEGPVPAGGTRSARAWAQVAEGNAALSDTARAAVELAVSKVPADTRLLLEAVAVSVLRGVAADTPVGRLAYLSEPGREGVWQLRAGDYSAQIAADLYGARYLKVTAVAPTSRAWVRIIADNTFCFSWTGLSADTPDARPMIQAGLDLFDANARWILPNHRMIFPAGNGSLEIRKPGVVLQGYGRGTHLDYQGTAGQFLGKGLILVSASDVTVEKMRFSLFAPGNSASNPACVAVSYTQPFLDGSTGPLPKLVGTKIREISCDRTSLGVIVAAYDRTNRNDGGIGNPEDTLIENLDVKTNGAAVSLFGAGATESRFFDLRWDSTLPLASPSAKQCGHRILGASDVRIGSGKMADFLQGFLIEADGARIKNRRIEIYGQVSMSNIRNPLLIAECLEWFRISGKILAKCPLDNTDVLPVVSVLSDQFLSAVDPSLPAEEKVSITQDVDLRNIDAEGYAAFLSQSGKMGKLTVEQNKCVGNANVSDTFGKRYAVLCNDPAGAPTLTRVNDNDFRMSASASTPSLTLRSSTGLIEARRNLLPERADIENSISVQTGSTFYADDIEQRPFNGVVNLGSNSMHKLGSLANYRSGTPFPAPALPNAAIWARNFVGTSEASNVFAKTAGGANAYDAGVYSTERLTGDLELLYRLRQRSDDLIVGLTSVFRGIGYGATDFATYYTANGAGSIYLRASFQIAQTKGYSADTIERWRRVGTRLIFSRGNVDLLTIPVSSDLALGVQASIARMGDAVEILRFGQI